MWSFAVVALLAALTGPAHAHVAYQIAAPADLSEQQFDPQQQPLCAAVVPEMEAASGVASGMRQAEEQRYFMCVWGTRLLSSR